MFVVAWVLDGWRALGARRACCEKLRVLVLAVQRGECSSGEEPMACARRLVHEGKIADGDLIDPLSGGDYVLLAEPVDTPHGRAVACSPVSSSRRSWWRPFKSAGELKCCILYLDGHGESAGEAECTQLVQSGKAE